MKFTVQEDHYRSEDPSCLEAWRVDKLLEYVRRLQAGLDPEVLAHWYRAVEAEAKSICPEDLRDKIEVRQDPILWMKFELRISRRAVPYFIEALERKLPEMPLTTRLYFEKLEEEVEKAYRRSLGEANSQR